MVKVALAPWISWRRA